MTHGRDRAGPGPVSDGITIRPRDRKVKTSPKILLFEDFEQKRVELADDSACLQVGLEDLHLEIRLPRMESRLDSVQFHLTNSVLSILHG